VLISGCAAFFTVVAAALAATRAACTVEWAVLTVIGAVCRAALSVCWEVLIATFPVVLTVFTDLDVALTFPFAVFAVVLPVDLTGYFTAFRP